MNEPKRQKTEKNIFEEKVGIAMQVLTSQLSRCVPHKLPDWNICEMKEQ